MRRIGLSLLTCLLVSATAQAFEAKPADTDSARSALPGKLVPGLGLEGQAEVSRHKKSTGGFELPGLGKLGVLPKLDFGLELLYGDTPPAAQSEDFEGRETDPEDLTIKGTFKHRF